MRKETSRRAFRNALRQMNARCERLERRMLLSMGAVGTETPISTKALNDQALPAVDMDNSGNFVVAWQSFGEDVSGDGIYAQRYNAAGTPQGGEFRVNSFTTNAQHFPAIAMDNDGDFVVVWGSVSQDGSSSGIYAQRYSSDGIAQGVEFRVNSFTQFLQDFPAVAMDANGDFVVAWQSYQDGGGYGVYAQRYNALGVAQGAEFRANSFTSEFQTAATVAMDDAGNFVIAWESGQQDGSLNGVYAQRYNSAGAAQGGEFRINEHTTGQQRFPSVGMDSDGDFAVTWQSASQDGSGYGVYARRYNALGQAQSSESRVNAHTNFDQSLPSIAMDDSGEFVIAWHSNLQDGSSLGIYAQGYDANGVAVGGQPRVNTYTTGAQSVPAVAIDADADVVIAWQSSGQDLSGEGVYAQRFLVGVGPAVLASDFHFATLPQRLTFVFDENVSASLTLADVTVNDLTNGGTIAPSGISYDVPSNTATVSFNTALPDANFSVTLAAAGITNSGGTPMVADYSRNFFFLRGDANHDARVNLADYNILSANFGGSPRDFTQGDFNYDNQVNLADYNVLTSRFGVELAGAESSGTIRLPFGGVPIGPGRDRETRTVVGLVGDVLQ